MYDYYDLMRESMDDRLLNFHDGSIWRLKSMLAAKYWLGYKTKGDPQFEPSEDQYGAYTERETDTLDALTGAHCTVTPKLYLLHPDLQDQSILRGKDGRTYWMPRGYIVYIVMQKLPAIPLNLDIFWNKFSQEKRTEIRTSFREGCL